MGCLNENTVVEFLEGKLEDADRVLVERHVDECGECRAVLAVVGKLLPHGATVSPVLPLAPKVSAWCRQGEVIAGKYRIERELGAGGMGVVVAATRLSLGELVAL